MLGGVVESNAWREGGLEETIVLIGCHVFWRKKVILTFFAINSSGMSILKSTFFDFFYINWYYLKHFHSLIDLWFCIFNLILGSHRTRYTMILFIFPIELMRQSFGNMIWIKLLLTMNENNLFPIKKKGLGCLF